VYVRISRFDGGSPEVVRAEMDRVRRDIGAMKAGGATDETTARLSSLVDRLVMAADPEGGRSAVIAFCETEEQLREVDRLMQGMSPATDQGHRVSLDLYEVVFDESPRSAASKAA